MKVRFWVTLESDDGGKKVEVFTVRGETVNNLAVLAENKIDALEDRLHAVCVKIRTEGVKDEEAA